MGAKKISQLVAELNGRVALLEQVLRANTEEHLEGCEGLAGDILQCDCEAEIDAVNVVSDLQALLIDTREELGKVRK